MTGIRPGFTGIDWQSRTPERLRTDLMAGAGAVPLADCADGWADLAADLDALVAVTRRTLDGLSEQWESAGARTTAAVLSRLPGWIDGLADRAAAQERLARAGLSALETARLAMPAAEAIDAARVGLARLTSTIGLSAMMTGGLVRAERAERELCATAARVMADYERDSEPVATAAPEHLPPPVLVRAAGASGTSTGSGGAAGVSGAVPGVSMPPAIAPPRILTAFAATPVTQVRRTPAGEPSSGAGGEPSATTRGVGAAGTPVGGGLGAMAPTSGSGAPRGASVSAVPGAVVGPAATPDVTRQGSGETGALTWAELAVGDEVRVVRGPTGTDSGHTTV